MTDDVKNLLNMFLLFFILFAGWKVIFTFIKILYDKTHKDEDDK